MSLAGVGIKTPSKPGTMWSLGIDVETGRGSVEPFFAALYYTMLTAFFLMRHLRKISVILLLVSREIRYGVCQRGRSMEIPQTDLSAHLHDSL